MDGFARVPDTNRHISLVVDREDSLAIAGSMAAVSEAVEHCASCTFTATPGRVRFWLGSYSLLRRLLDSGYPGTLRRRTSIAVGAAELQPASSQSGSGKDHRVAAR
jgi:hypothetical protein